MAREIAYDARSVQRRMQELRRQLEGELERLSQVEEELSELECQLEALQRSLHSGEPVGTMNPGVPRSLGAPERWGPN